MKPKLAAGVGGNQRQAIRKPANVFKSCPKCESPNLIKFDAEAFCSYCDWNSIEVFAAACLAIAGRRS